MQNFGFLKKGKKIQYLERWVSLDTETSHNHNEENPKAWIYQWAFKFGEEISTGRKPSELLQALENIKSDYELDEYKRLVIYVHNLSYDISYIKQWLIEKYGSFEMIAVQPHHFISFTINAFEFRCSYKLSNRSLSKWAKDLNCTHRKLDGAIDYSAIHYQDEELTQIEWDYQLEDVYTLDECIEKQFALYGDNVVSTPLTSTSYVRREARKNFREEPKAWYRFQDTKLNEITYKMCRSEFSGGITHGNRFLANQTICANIRHRDFVSHYPSQQRTQDFPLGKYNYYGKDLTIQECMALTKKYFILLDIIISDLTLKTPDITFPYLQESKVRQGRLTQLDIVSDNGRILTFRGVSNICVDENDLKWIVKQYRGKIKVNKVFTAVRGKLPDYLIKTIDEFMLQKTHFKILAKREKDEATKREYEMSLMKAKNGLNGIYGMSATALVRIENKMDEFGAWSVPTGEDIKAGLEKYYKSRNSFMRYQFGCATTSHARNELMTFIELVGYENAIYCDTDSIFYISTPEIEKRIEDYNKRLYEDSINKKAFVEVDGERVVYNQFVDEEETITKFRFLHSKCYAYEEDGKLHTTIAGVNRRKYIFDENCESIIYTREEELKDIEELKDGKVFHTLGGTRCVYGEEAPHKETINGHETELSSYAIILEVDKTLNYSIDKDVELFTQNITII